MSREMEDLLDLLKSVPNQVLLSDDGTRLYSLVGPDDKLMVAFCGSKNFQDMTEEEVNEFIQNLLK
jgi:hypothetical protein